MRVTKKQITDGLIKFIGETLIPDSHDGQLKFVLSMMKDTIRKKPDTVDYFLDNPVISSSITQDDDMYEIGHFTDTMRDILEDCEYYPIAVPEIPLLSPARKVLKITESDFESLVSAIRGEETATVEEEE